MSSSAARSSFADSARACASSASIFAGSPAKSLRVRTISSTLTKRLKPKLAETAATETPAGTDSLPASRSRKSSSVDFQTDSAIWISGQSDDAARFRIQIDVVISGTRGQSRHRAHGAEQGIEKARAHAGAYVAHRHDKPRGSPFQIRIVTQAEMRLRHAYRKLVETISCVQLDFFLSFRGIFYARATVHFSHNRLDLLLDAGFQRIEEFEVGRFRARRDHRFTQFHGASPALRPVIRHHRILSAGCNGGPANQFDFSGRIVGETIHRHNNWNPEGTGILNHLDQIR